MVSRTPERPDREPSPEPVGNPDWSPWVLLLVVPVAIPLMTPLYNRVEPELFGIPAFYWMQLVFVPMSAALTGLVYFKTRKR